MFNFKNKLVPTPHSRNDLEYFCHSELVSESYQNRKSAGLPRFARNDGFTLAEVLITLVIIGVIAAITVPTLIAKYQKEQTVTRLKKAYSALAQTTARAVADNGPLQTWEIGQTYNKDDAKVFFERYLKPYLSIMKYSEENYKVNFLNPSLEPFNPDDFGHITYFLADGTLLSVAIGGDEDTRFLDVLIDINGLKKPNTFGKDVFFYTYCINYNWNPQNNGKFIPNGFDNHDYDYLIGPNEFACNKNAPMFAGYQCAAVIMKNGWRIPDDYPW